MFQNPFVWKGLKGRKTFCLEFINSFVSLFWRKFQNVAFQGFIAASAKGIKSFEIMCLRYFSPRVWYFTGTLQNQKMPFFLLKSYNYITL